MNSFGICSTTAAYTVCTGATFGNNTTTGNIDNAMPLISTANTCATIATTTTVCFNITARNGNVPNTSRIVVNCTASDSRTASDYVSIGEGDYFTARNSDLSTIALCRAN